MILGIYEVIEDVHMIWCWAHCKSHFCWCNHRNMEKT